MTARVERGERSEMPRSKEKVILQEVGPRDGLQNEKTALPPETRVELIERLVDAGIPRIQIGSFVSPKLVPQMAGADQIWRSLQRKQDVRYSVLVLNERGLEQARDAGAPHVEVYVSASETHSMKNSHMRVEKALSEACRIVEQARSYGIAVTAGVMCAFGCYYEGGVPVEKVLEIVEALEGKNPTEIGLADTTGMADPALVESIIDCVTKKVLPDRIALHLHDTRGLGLANLRQALQMGVTRFDSSAGGLGGCPFVPGAPGNIATERVVETVQALGYETGIDSAQIRLIAADFRQMLGRTSGLV